jgi:hypothetical protein
VSLFYDNNAAVGNDVTNSSLIPFDYHDSTNLGYGGGFNPNAVGEYGFALVAYDSAHVELGRSAILVEVNAVPDSGSTSLMLGGALVVGILFRRRAARK